jgi:hypothetical protein
MSIDYSQLDRAELERRCEAAEKVCVLYGWSAWTPVTERQQATLQLWMDWHATVPDGFLNPAEQQELDREIPELARRRRDAATVARQLAQAMLYGSPARPVCEVHGQTDCSPLLNGCSRLTARTGHGG